MEVNSKALSSSELSRVAEERNVPGFSANGLRGRLGRKDVFVENFVDASVVDTLDGIEFLRDRSFGFTDLTITRRMAGAHAQT